MSEELYFFKLNKERAKVSLSALISEDSDFSFRQFVSTRTTDYEYPDRNLSFEDILTKVQQDISLLLVDDMWAIFYWFYKKYVSHDYATYHTNYESFLSAMRENGLDLLYEMDNKSPIRKLHSILGDYEGATGKDMQYICSVQDFRNFLDYTICFSGKISQLLDEWYYKDNDSYDEIRKNILKSTARSGEVIYNLALGNFKRESEGYRKIISESQQLTEFHRVNAEKTSYSLPTHLSKVSDNLSDLLNLADAYNHATYLYEQLDGYDGMIARLHSY